MKDSVFTASGTLLSHLLMAEEESYGKCLLVVRALYLLLSRQKSTDTQEMLRRCSGDALLSFIAVTCDSKTASAFQRHTGVS